VSELFNIATLPWTCGVRMSPALEKPGFKSDGLRHARVNLPRQEVWHRWSAEASCWSDAHWIGASLITAVDNGNVVCSVSWIIMAVTLNTRFTDCLYCKTVVVTRCVEIFYGVKPTYYSTTFLQIIKLDQTCWYTWRPLASYAVITIKLASCHLLLYYYY